MNNAPEELYVTAGGLIRVCLVGEERGEEGGYYESTHQIIWGQSEQQFFYKGSETVRKFRSGETKWTHHTKICYSIIIPIIQHC